jgi:tetratricopeptide (TPR) repeat protein
MEISMKKSFPAILFLALFLLLPHYASAEVKVSKGTITIPTYPWGSDVNPKFWALEGGIKSSVNINNSIIYPYTMQDEFSSGKVDQTYRALFLENEYLKVTCLPELGGRIYSVLDKTENKQMFHYNPVIKPSKIAMRAAFITGGVEWNAGPQTHTVTLVSPVNALVGENRDGSAYIEVSNLEQSLRTRWTVRVTLHPQKAYLDEEISIVNPTEGMQPYYFWNCTSFVNLPGTRFIYPMTVGTDHYGVKSFSWPVHEGKDMTWLKNYEAASSIFAYQCSFDFFGAYDVDLDRGIIQVANHHELVGKKAWTWGEGDYGRIHQKALADDGSHYIEVQSGPLPTQSDYGMLAPRGRVAWREWWYPVHGLGDGFEYANQDLAVQTERRDGKLNLLLYATGKFPQSTCTLTRENKVLLEKSLDLSPENPQPLTLSPAPAGPVNVTVKSSEDTVIAEFTTPLPIPEVTPPDPEKFKEKPDEQLTVEEIFLRGQKYDRATNRKKARQYYEMALARDSRHSPSLRGLAVLDIEAALYSQAAKNLELALERHPSDGLAWYFLGICHLRQTHEQDALNCAYQAAKLFPSRSLGYDLAGRIHMRRHEYNQAVEAFTKALRSNPADNMAQNHLLLARYAQNTTQRTRQRLQRRITQNPSDLVPRALQALQDESEMKKFASSAREFMGEDDFEMIETSLFFAEVGLFDEAQQILSATCVEALPSEQRSPLTLYYLAYFAAQQNKTDIAQDYLAQAAGTCRDFVFPSRPQAIEVLQYALKKNPDDANAHLHLGNLFGHLGRLYEAVSSWQNAARLDSSLSIAWRNLGLYYWSAENKLAQAEEMYRQAIAARPQDQTLYRDLTEILLDADKRTDAITLLESTTFDKPRRSEITIMLTQSYIDEQRLDDAIDLLESTTFHAWEGQRNTWEIFSRAHIERGQKYMESNNHQAALRDFDAALTYPDNLGVGRPDQPQEAYAHYHRALALKALDKVNEARLAFQTGADGLAGNEQQNKYRILCREALENTP